MNGETKNNKNVKIKKAQVSKRKVNSNLDWYYKNNFKKKNGKNYNNYRKNNSPKKGNKKNIIKNVEQPINNNYSDVQKKEVNNFNVSPEIKKDFWSKLIINRKKKKILNSDIVEVEKDNNYNNKFNIFKRKYRKKEEENIVNNEKSKTITPRRIKTSQIEENSLLNNKKDNIDVDKITLIKKDKFENKSENDTLDEFNIVKKLDKTLYGFKKLNLSNDSNTKKNRKKIYLKESLFISLIFSFVNVAAYYLIDDALIINITNLKYLNIIITFIFSFILLFIISYIIDYIVTEFLVKRKNKKQLKEGDTYRNRGFVKGENKENIEFKKGK